ncbi:MAG TPA: hypothetical protein VGB91_00445 [Rhizomicrobium sp.]
MDFTYPTALFLAAAASLSISVLTLVICMVSGSAPPKSYRRTVIVLVAVFVIAISLRWTDWRNILLRRMGLLDLAFILSFSAVGGFVGTLPLRLAGKWPRRGASS